MNASKHKTPSPHPGRRHGRRHARVGLLTASLLAVAAWLFPAFSLGHLEEGMVRTTDGKTLEGDVVEEDGQVQVTSNGGIVTRLPAERVASIIYGTPEERLRKQHDALAEGAYAARLAVARQAMNRDLLDLAEEIAADVLEDEPRNVQADQLLDQIGRRRQINEASGTGVAREQPEGRGGRATTRMLRPGDMGLLTDEQINRIRQAELQPADAMRERNRVRVNFRDGVINRFVETQPNLSFRAFDRQDDVFKALYILESDVDRTIKDDVQITSEPVSLLSYLREVEPIILNGCATSGCHGSPGQGDFVLYPNARDTATSYTNYYLVNTYSKPIEERPGGAFGEGPRARQLVDRVNHDQSLLLHYMLPPDEAAYPHPPISGFTPVAADTSAEPFRIVQNWISQVLQPLPTGFGFEFQPDLPTTRPTTGPATAPATAPADPSTRPAADPPDNDES